MNLHLNTVNKEYHMYYGRDRGVFGHDGYVGTFGCADPDTNITFGLTKTLLDFGKPARSDTLTKLRFEEPVDGKL